MSPRYRSTKARSLISRRWFGLYNTLVYPGQKTLGIIDPARMAALQKFYVQQGIVQKETPIGDLYTNEFVQ
jgi:NitT/TauT family transport system substrate-binding protein